MSRRQEVLISSDTDVKRVVYGLTSVELPMAGLDRTNGDNPNESAEYRCEKCGGGLDRQTGDGEVYYIAVKDGSPDCIRGGKHDPSYQPLSWANSAGVELDEEGDSIRVNVSVSDPRGAFVLTIRRYVDDDGVEQLLMHVPHPDDSAPHAPLTEIHPGTYRIG